MAENRCPMCSKTNPSEADVCQHCGARLKPLFIESTEEDPQANRSTGPFSPQSPASDSDQLLRETFSADQQLSGGDTDSDEGSRPGNDEDAWLARFRSEAIPEDSPGEMDPVAFQESSEGSPSDVEPWMDSFRSNLLGGELDLDRAEDVESDAEEAAIEPDADWISRFRSGIIPDSTDEIDLHTADTSRLEPRSVEEAFPESTDFASHPEVPEKPDTFELPDWPDPSEKGSRSRDESGLQQPAGATPGDVPDWLSGLKEEDEAIPKDLPAADDTGWMEKPAEAAPGDVPDWLSGLKEEVEPIPEDLPAADDTGWMEEPAEATPGEVPDWLSGLKEEVEPIPEDLPAADDAGWMEEPAEATPGEVPDWLSGLKEEDEAISADQVPDLGSSERKEDEDLAVPANIPEWLSGIRKQEDTASTSDEELWEAELKGPSEKDVPDWLSVFSNQEEDQEASEGSSQTAAVEMESEQTLERTDFEEEGISTGPDMGVEALDAFSAFNNLRPAQEKADTPDWLREAFDTDTESLLEDEEESRKQLEDLMEEESGSDGLPEWFAAPGQAPLRPAVDPPVEQPVDSDVIHRLDEADNEENRAATPLWLQNIIDETRVDVEAELESAMAETLTSDKATEAENQGIKIEESASDQDEWVGEPLPDSLYDDEKELDLNLEGADLPSWLQDARTNQEAETGRLQQEEQETPDQELPEIDFSAIEEEDEVLPNLELMEYEPGKSLFDEFQEMEEEEPAWTEQVEDELSPEEPALDEPEENLDSAEMPEWLSQVHARQTKETTMLSWEPPEEIEPSTEDQTTDEQSSDHGREAIGEQIIPEKSVPEKSAAPWLDDLSIEFSEDQTDDLDADLQPEGLLDRKFVSADEEKESESFDFSFESDSPPEWMADLSEEKDSESAEEIESISLSLSGPESLRPFSLKNEAAHVEEGLEWLDELPEEQAPTLESEAEEEKDIQDAEMPDWLSQIRQRQSGKTAFLRPLEELEAEESRESLLEDIGEAEPSAWPPRRMDEEEKKELEQDSKAGLEGLIGYEEHEDEHPGTKPVWLEDLPDSPLSPPSAPAFVAGSLPVEEEKGIDDFDLTQERQSVWVDDIKPGEMQPELKGADRINLARATLPAWLEAMRPVEGMFGEPGEASREQDSVETAGPLAGISGALSAEPAVAAQHKIRSGSSVLNISDGEYERADLLSRLLADEETELKPIPRHIGSQKRLRWIVSVVLILASLIPSLFGFPAFPLPVQEPLDLDALFSIVNEIPADTPALVIYDVEPGYSAEMEAVAGPMFYHLLGRQIPVITLSTEVTGPALVDRIIRNISLPFFPENGQDYLHLGYLSGGASGIQQFTRNPAHSGLDGYMIPEGFLESNDSIWKTPMLSGISSLNQFSMVTLVVNDSDRARMWIEQAGPVIGDTPFVLVVSTGLEPVVRPYYEGRNPLVDGLLASVPAAAAYDLRFQRTGDAAMLWNPYNATLTIVFIAFAVAIAKGLYGLIKDRQQRAENGDS